MPIDDNNQRITIAVLSKQLESIEKKLDEAYRTISVDHDKLIALEAQISDIVWLKRSFGGMVISVLAALGIAIYALILQLP